MSKSTKTTDTGDISQPYIPDPNLTAEENSNRAREHKLRQVAAEPGPQKVSFDELQRGTAPGSNVDPGDGNPFNSNPPIDPEILRMRRERLEDHEAQQRIELAQHQADAAKKAADDAKAAREADAKAREDAKKSQQQASA